MSRPTLKELAARWWEFRPSPVGVLVATGLLVAGAAVSDVSVWLCVTLVLVAVAALTGLSAWLDLRNEAAEQAEREAADRAGDP